MQKNLSCCWWPRIRHRTQLGTKEGLSGTLEGVRVGRGSPEDTWIGVYEAISMTVVDRVECCITGNSTIPLYAILWGYLENESNLMSQNV